MPFPDGVQVVTLTAGASGYRTLDGDPYTGTIRLTPSVSRVVSAEHGVIALGVENITVGASGQFSTTVLATDADGFSPSGWTYRVDEEFTNAPGRAYNISLPASAATVALTALSPVDSTTGTVSSPAVLSVNGETGIVNLTAADVDADPEGTASTTVAAHSADTTAVHGIADTSLLETATGATAKVTAHTAATDPHADRAFTTTSISTHAAATDPHGDRAYADSTFATITVVNTLTGTVTTLSGTVSTLNGFVNDCLSRVAAIEQGSAFLSGLNVDGDAQVANGNLTVTDFVKGYRFRTDGSALDLEATGVDLLFSNWSGSGFNGTQRSYARLSADALNTQWAGKFESVTALYGAAVHTLDPATGIASLGGKNGLGAIRLAGFKNSAGAPATGTWAAGDVVLDSAGAWHLCTVGGEPGTWT